jgi:hypothetical protein
MRKNDELLREIERLNATVKWERERADRYLEGYNRLASKIARQPAPSPGDIWMSTNGDRFIYTETDWVKTDFGITQKIEWKGFSVDAPTPVNHPSHYNQNGIEVLDILKAYMTREQYLGFLRGNMLKYSLRAPYKGNEDQDLEKMRFYTAQFLDEIRGDKK